MGLDKEQVTDRPMLLGLPTIWIEGLEQFRDVILSYGQPQLLSFSRYP